MSGVVCTMNAPVLTSRQVAELCGVSVPTVRLWRAEGTGPAYSVVDDNVRYSFEGVERWIDSKLGGAA